MVSDPVSNFLWEPNSKINFKKKIITILRKIKNKLRHLNTGLNYLPILHVFFGKNWHYKKLQKSYCLHLWKTAWWDKYLVNISEQFIKANNGNFSKIIRKNFDI